MSKKFCSVSGCEKLHHAKGLCSTHSTIAWISKNYEKHKASARKFSRTLKGRFSRLKSNARKRDISVSLTFNQYCKIASKLCQYCDGALPASGSGLDRKNSKLGYSINNVVACCAVCNDMKGAHLTYEEMLLICAIRKSSRKP
jgi:hypothetical protein